MTDYTELKRLAEACGDLNWRFLTEKLTEYGIRDDHGYIAFLPVGHPAKYGACPAREAKANFLGAMTPAVIMAMITENERLQGCEDVLRQLASHVGAGGYNAPEVDPEVFARKILDGINILNDPLAQLVLEKGEQIEQLKAENERLKSKLEQARVIGRISFNFDAYEKVLEERDQFKAENEVLRDDIEQSQYDANAWRNQEESVWIEAFHSDGDDPFISAITGQITIEQLSLIQAQIVEYREDYFEKGPGLYVFRCAHYQAHYDNVGMTEPAHWETDFESYSPFPWEEERVAMGKGEQS